MHKEVIKLNGKTETIELNKKQWKQRLKSADWEMFMVPTMLVVLFIILTVSNEYFFTLNNFRNVLQQISILAIVSAGMTFVIISGGFDLSVGSVVALTGSVASIVMIQYGILIGILAGLVIGFGIGIINGVLVGKFNISPFIATLGMLVIARGLALGITKGSAVFNLPAQFGWLGGGQISGIPVPVIIAVIIYIIGIIILRNMTFGLKIYAVGGNKESARLSGIPVGSIVASTYIICSLCASLAGIILAARLRAGEPTAAVSMELFAIAAVVLGGASLKGGKGALERTILGVLFIGVLENGLNLLNIPFYWQQVVIGLVFITASCVNMLKTKEP